MAEEATESVENVVLDFNPTRLRAQYVEEITELCYARVQENYLAERLLGEEFRETLRYHIEMALNAGAYLGWRVANEVDEL